MDEARIHRKNAFKAGRYQIPAGFCYPERGVPEYSMAAVYANRRKNSHMHIHSMAAVYAGKRKNSLTHIHSVPVFFIING